VGIIIGTFYVSGLGMKLADFTIFGSGGELWLALVFTAIASLVLGMGLPTPTVYITVAIIITPAIIKIGADPLAAHLFVFYSAMISGFTPPMAIPALAAAGIADARAVAILLQRRGAARVHLALPPLFGSKKRSNPQ
jgi:TRAP-type uncharacterized transport system fused permease subunit